MHPAAGASGGATRSVRAVARAGILLGMAAMALVAATMLNDPGDLLLQRLLLLLCLAMVAEAQGLRKAALDLVLLAVLPWVVVQAVFAVAAADVAAAGSLRGQLGWWLTTPPADILAAINAWSLCCYVLSRAAVFAIRQCAGH